jgi:hypothetical protein
MLRDFFLDGGYGLLESMALSAFRASSKTFGWKSLAITVLSVLNFGLAIGELPCFYLN